MGYRIFLGVLLVAAALYTISARFIPMDPWTAAELVNAQTLPTIYGTTLVVALAWLLIRGRPPAAPPSPYRVLRVAGVGVLVAAFVVLLDSINLWIGLGGLIGLTAMWLGERRWLPILALSVLIPLSGYLGVERALGLYLPG
ncbi:MAG: tripartite tricarboxylate transporter TctB family protein [Pseudomonadales bacterium]|jgi:hypothetical protein